MARGWRVIDASSFEGEIGGSHGRLTLTNEAHGRREVPAEEIAVLLAGPRTSLTTTALHYAAKHDTVLLACDWRGIPFGAFHPWSDHTRVGARHLAQAAMSLPRRKVAWKQIVVAKIKGQSATLESVDVESSRELLAMSGRVRSGDTTNVEGTAARFYWGRLFHAEQRFIRDQDSGDDLNAMLNYGYTILRGFGIRAVLSAGLSPPLGLFHRGRSNYFNLVDDLIEPFRPAIDHEVVALAGNSSLADSAAKQRLVAAVTQTFLPDGTGIPAALEDLAQQVGRYVEGDIERLRVHPWAGPR